MSREQSGEKKAFDPGDYPALLEFLPAYWHQDFAEEYGSAAKAAKSFITEASGDEIVQLREEWKALRAKFRGKPLDEIQGALERFGCAWLPGSEDELKEVDEILDAAQS